MSDAINPRYYENKRKLLRETSYGPIGGAGLYTIGNAVARLSGRRMVAVPVARLLDFLPEGITIPKKIPVSRITDLLIENSQYLRPRAGYGILNRLARGPILTLAGREAALSLGLTGVGLSVALANRVTDDPSSLVWGVIPVGLSSIPMVDYYLHYRTARKTLPSWVIKYISRPRVFGKLISYSSLPAIAAGILYGMHRYRKQLSNS